jgi:hypothetical protein
MGRGAVLVLRALVLALDDDAGGNVGDAHGRIGRIDVLAAGTGCAVGINAKVLVLDNDLNLIVNLRIDKNRGKRRVTALVRVERRDPHQPMTPISAISKP